MNHDFYKEWVDFDREVDYLVAHAGCSYRDARMLVTGEMRYVEASTYEEDCGEYIFEPDGLNLVKFVEAATWSFEIEAAMGCAYDGTPAFEPCFVIVYMEKQPDIDLPRQLAFDLVNAQFPNLWGVEAQKKEMRRYFAEAKVGSSVMFGRNTLGADDTSQNFWWDVLAKEENRALLVSRCVIDCRPYNNCIPDPFEFPFGDDFFDDGNYDAEAFEAWAKKNPPSPATWQTCDLRAWLNGEFINSTFNGWECELIAKAAVETADVSNVGGKVFCLSIDEVREYFGGSATSTRCKPTEYAEARGVEVSDNDDLAHEPEVVLDDRTKSASWWLRSIVLSGGSAAYVNAAGGVNLSGASMDNTSIGVRPAIWVNIA